MGRNKIFTILKHIFILFQSRTNMLELGSTFQNGYTEFDCYQAYNMNQ